MEFNQLKELLEQFNESSIREFKLDKDGFQLYLNKNNVSQAVATETVKEVSQPEPVIETTEKELAAEPQVIQVTGEGQTVDSPIVGIAYLSSSPEEPVFKKVGDTVAVGDTLCIVEAMKIMNEITSDVAGTVTEVLVKNEDVVEYGQPLFRIV